MKKTILLGALLFALHCSYSFANEKDKGISEQVKASFRHEFINAEEVQWEDLEEYVKANFKLYGQALSAYFYPNGDLLAVTRNISSDQLPIRLLITLKSKYAGYWITELVEMSEGGGTSYFITINDGTKKKVLQSEEGADWQLYSINRIIPRRKKM